MKKITCCTFSPDDSLILFGKLETALNIAERKEVPFFPGNKETFLSCSFSPNGKRLVTSDGSNTIKLWNVAKQRLLTSLCAEVSVDLCSFSITGLFIIGNSESAANYGHYSLCIWNAITLERCDKQKSSHRKLDERGALKSRKCERCYQRIFKEPNPKQLEIKSCSRYGSGLIMSCPWICKGEECIFLSEVYYDSSVTECISSTAAAAWNYFVVCPSRIECDLFKTTALEDNLWLYKDMKKLFVLKTLAPTQKQSCLLNPTKVYSSSFSPDGPRLASCTSDGYTNIWNVNTNQVKQRFEGNPGEYEFFC